MPETLSQVVVVILFIIPGFVFTRVLGFSIPLRGRETAPLVLDSLAVSCINYALLSPVVWVTMRENFSAQHPVWFAGLWFVILFFSPTILAFLAIRFVDSPRAQWLRRALRLTHPIPKAWDYFFRQGKQCWVLATLKDDRIVAGLYSTDSFASSYPEEEDLYLEKLCTLSPEGRITGLVEGSEGVILTMADVELLELYSVER
ncbi:MAG: DUF6338 family protein [Terriglobia bacterium]